MLRLGVIGYSAQKFDVKKARKIIKKEFNYFKRIYGNDIIIVSGLTAMGIPLTALIIFLGLGYFKVSRYHHWNLGGPPFLGVS